ncbi:MAG: class I SAM-dependent methyltransferase [Bacteroidota bacterium]
MAWYEAWFDSDAYEVVYQNRNLADARCLLDLIERVADPAPDAALLDVACGRGRHARLLAQRGYDVTGLDLSANAIATARHRAEQEGLTERVRFVVGDMRLPHFQQRFDGVVNLFTSFGYFQDEADHARAVDAIAQALRPGGFVVQDFLNADYVRAHLVPEDERTIDGIDVRQERWIDEDAPGGPRVEKRITLCCFERDDAEGIAAEDHVFTESVRLLTRSDFTVLYEHAGLTLLDTFGDYDGGPHTPESPRLILHARRAG